MAITKVGESQSFGYTGGVQSFTAPYGGLYKIEVWGASGGYGWTNGDTSYQKTPGGKGGYSAGYILLKKKDVIYIVCGGAGTQLSPSTGYGVANGGYNGGGYSYRDSGWHAGPSGSGGGATHIAKNTGAVLSSTSLSNVLIVAGGGGGGGGSRYFSERGYGSGGSGGGTNGSNGTPAYGNSVADSYGRGGTQTSGGQSKDGATGSYGKGGDHTGKSLGGTGGGGGLYGGGTGQRDGREGDVGGGGGGSGYIGGVPTITYKGVTYSPSTSNGVNSGNGSAKITLMKKFMPTTYYGDQSVEALYYGDHEVAGLFFGDHEVS